MPLLPDVPGLSQVKNATAGHPDIAVITTSLQAGQRWLPSGSYQQGTERPHKTEASGFF